MVGCSVQVPGETIIRVCSCCVGVGDFMEAFAGSCSVIGRDALGFLFEAVSGRLSRQACVMDARYWGIWSMMALCAS